jgi:hypothetical protein
VEEHGALTSWSCRCAPFPKQAKYRADKPLELVHGDLCGPITLATPGGQRYNLLLVDDATRYMWVAFLTEKSSTPESITMTGWKNLRSKYEEKTDLKQRKKQMKNKLDNIKKEHS